MERSFITSTVKEALGHGLKAMILKESSKRELCMMGLKIGQRVNIIPK